jgi:hypothetical protein
MADIKISQLPQKTTPMGASDLLEVSEATFIPGAFVSKKMRRDKLVETIIGNIPSGSFYDNTTQTATANTPTAMLISQTGFLNDVSLSGTTGMQVTNAGYYNVQFSAQVFRTTGSSSQHIDIWLRVNGTDEANTNSRVNINDHSIYHVAAWNWFLLLAASDIVEIMYSVTAATIELRSEVANLIIPHPETPSVIATINRIG